ncbi:hypothetical protein AB6Q13_23580 [Ralstonia solanacearum]|uniref:Uncharacterized protein n=1 Tax=Ralstonia solanacearum TaxID=305 RepID=A0AAE3NCN7_RALSL|nr:hypothetical protein [Ralstonia solanacearum]MBB6584995.1 hypothetical protein [Ralstonia solanacearum]MDB0520652.1 hypothetical protein [Ralstonia solanacearum]MDB0568321.1 hypothetical protein [Ralstonia solanacearum]MDB0576702.1 hypothetical protein [Ralstonia solanacearum]QHB56360.1 hypothetical protein GRB31_14820 [Ralstonia solanacearum]
MSPASPALLCWPIALLLLGRSLAFGWRGSFIGRDGLAGHPVAFWTEVVGGCVLALLVAVTGWAH